MHMKLDDIELAKREDRDGSVKEIRSIHSLSVVGKRAIVELAIPGSDGNVFQDMGRNPSVIAFEGELVGPNAESTLQNLKTKFEMKKPIPFSSDVALVSDITSVIIEKFSAQFISGVNLGFRYSMVLKENMSASKGGKRGPGETEPPSQEESSKKEVQQRINQAYEATQKTEKTKKKTEESAAELKKLTK